ncbi:MAG: MFS transporter [Eubacterium sp.]
MAESIKAKAKNLIDQVRFYWKEPPKGRYMSFKEIAAYSFGGIGAYLIVSMSYTALLAATNVFITGTIGIGPTDMYILYVIATLANIPLTGLRANIIDNTRNKEGKYRPYILRMGIPTVILFIGLTWFPYDSLKTIVGTGELLGKSADYIAKCAVVLFFNLLLQFFYYFFYDSYENLIHVLSPNSQERADVASIKSIIYSLGPSIVNFIMPIIAQNVFHTNQTDIRVYRLLFPILGILGILLCVIVYANTQEKIVQAKTHVIQIKFIDALKAVAKNKYFWILSLAGWIGFLESAYNNILNWLYNYGGACSGNTYSIVITLSGNSALWGMILAPFCIRKWGKKKVLVFTNILNIIFILAMLLFTNEINKATIWGVLFCLYLNGIVGAFMHILNPAMNADIRDYQQYKTGERIDGMFAAVATIGSVLTLLMSGVIPAIQERIGMTVENAKRVVGDSQLMSRILPGNQQTIGQMLVEQSKNGQDIYNAANALYDVQGVLLPLLHVLIIVSAVGAFLNVVPYFWYDFEEKKQKSIVRVLKLRALFEDFGNNALKDRELVEAIDMVNDAREMASATPKDASKSMYKGVKGKEEKKAAKKAYREALQFNEDIEISQFVCQELDKFDTDFVKHQVEVYQKVYDEGLDGIKNLSLSDAKAELKAAKALPKTNQDEKDLRKFEIEVAKKKISSIKAYNKFFGSVNDFVEPDMAILDGFFNIEDECDDKIAQLSKDLHTAKKDKDREEASKLKLQIKEYEQKRKDARKASKTEMDKHAYFNRASEAYIDARKLLVQKENFSHFDEIAAMYDEAKARADEEDRIKEQKAAERQKELEKELADRKAAKKRK